MRLEKGHKNPPCNKFLTLVLICFAGIAVTPVLCNSECYGDKCNIYPTIYVNSIERLASRGSSMKEVYNIVKTGSADGLRLKWTLLSLGGKMPWCNDGTYVIVTLGCGYFYKSKMKFCGEEVPHDIYSNDGCIKLEFYNPPTSISKYFSVEIFAVRYNYIETSKCGKSSQTLNEEKGVIISPAPFESFSSSMEMDCTWKIKAPSSRVIQINIMNYLDSSTFAWLTITGTQRVTGSVFKKKIFTGVYTHTKSFNTESYEVEIHLHGNNQGRHKNVGDIIIGWTTFLDPYLPTPLPATKSSRYGNEESDSKNKFQFNSMGVFIGVIAFVLVISLSCARVYRRSRIFGRQQQQGAIMVGNDPTTGTVVVNSNVNSNVNGGTDQVGLLGKDASLSPFYLPLPPRYTETGPSVPPPSYDEALNNQPPSHQQPQQLTNASTTSGAVSENISTATA